MVSVGHHMPHGSTYRAADDVGARAKALLPTPSHRHDMTVPQDKPKGPSRIAPRAQPPRTRPRRLLMSFQTAWAGAGSGEVPGRALSLAAARRGWAWLFHGMR